MWRSISQWALVNATLSFEAHRLYHDFLGRRLHAKMGCRVGRRQFSLIGRRLSIKNALHFIVMLLQLEFGVTELAIFFSESSNLPCQMCILRNKTILYTLKLCNFMFLFGHDELVCKDYFFEFACLFFVILTNSITFISLLIILCLMILKLLLIHPYLSVEIFLKFINMIIMLLCKLIKVFLIGVFFLFRIHKQIVLFFA